MMYFEGKTQDEVENLAESIAMKVAIARDFLRQIPRIGEIPMEDPRHAVLIGVTLAVKQSLQLLTDSVEKLENITPQLKL